MGRLIRAKMTMKNIIIGKDREIADMLSYMLQILGLALYCPTFIDWGLRHGHSGGAHDARYVRGQT